MVQLGSAVGAICRKLRSPASSAPVLALLFVAAFAATATAQLWPEYPFKTPHGIQRGPGFYLGWPKLLAVWLLFLIWVKTTDWVSQDCQRVNMSYAIWNPIVFFPFLIAFFLAALTFPVFAVGCGIAAVAWLAPLLVYVVQRNSIVEQHEKVMTPAHIRFLISEVARKIGINIAAEARAAHEKGAQVDFEAVGEAQEAQAKLISARQLPGFVPAKAMIANAVDHFAEKIMLDYSQQGVSSRYQVDGVWHDADDRDRAEGDNLLGVLKTLGGLDPAERRKRQEARFSAKYDGRDLNCTLVSQGTKTGERALISFSKAGVPFKSLEELGMREKMIERLKELMLSPTGILIFSAMPDGGLSTTMNVALHSTDRLLRDFVAVVDKRAPFYEVENVEIAPFDGAAGETPFSVLDAIARKQPDVILVPNLSDANTVNMLCDLAVEDHLVFASLRAKEAVEVPLRVLLLKVKAKKFAPRAIGVLNQRLARRLCETCKEGFEPPPALLKKLGIPAGRVEMLYRHPENPDKVCPDCHGIGYRGRVGIFELLTVDKSLREALIKQPKLDVLRKVARRAGHRTLQEEGVAAVVQGVTSLPELMRILKQ